MHKVIQFFANGLRKKIKMTRLNDDITIEIIPFVDHPPPNAPLDLIEAFAKENQRSMANPGIAVVPLDVFLHPEFQKLISPEKEPAP